MNPSLLASIALIATLGLAGCQKTTEMSRGPLMISPATMVPVATVDERYQSYNVEMLEITGGAFWKPYGSAPTAVGNDSATPAGMDPNIYQYRPPLDLANRRLRTLAAALGPAYVRVSGTWANTTYFSDSDTPPTKPPAGFNGILTRAQWKGVVDFANAVDAEVISSFAVSPGVRDASGRWTSDQAQRWLDYTRQVSGRIAAAEYMNEPDLAAMGGAPEGYTAADYGRDFKAFKAFADRAEPEMIVIGPGSVGETPGPWSMEYGSMPIIESSDLLAASGPGIDAFSYHHYGAASQRCAKVGMPQTTESAALSEEWLGRTDQTLAYYAELRDRYEPDKPMWLTEVADAACGGNPWAGTFTDSFRYLDQLGRLAKAGVQVVAHNTLVASDYGLLNDTTLEPKPNYWAALLWRQLMGTTVLESAVPIQGGLHVYAHCQRGTPGGVTVLVINNDRAGIHSLRLPLPSMRYTLDATRLDDTVVRLNGEPLKLEPNDVLPRLTGAPTLAGKLAFAPATITFVSIPSAANTHCR